MRPTDLLPAVIMLMPGGALFAQGEELRALSSRHLPEAAMARAKADVNTHFIFQNEPQALPLMDDFSIDRTRSRWVTTEDPSVTLSATLYRLTLNGLSTPDMAFMEDTTYRYTIDLSIPDTIIFGQEPLPSVEVVLLDLSQYPPTEQTVTAWPPYNLIDSLQNPPPDTTWILLPDLRQDSLLVYEVAPDLSTYLMGAVTTPLVLWEDDDVYVNGTYPLNPPTVGVATFDGLSRTGMPYNFAQYSSYGIADRLTSVRINMAGSVADSIYLSFYYQARGLSGDAFPQPQDSLVLEFYAPEEDEWYRVWGTPYPTDLAVQPFRQVMIPIKEFRYLLNGFRMRFLNYATLSGSFDHWHLDYVRLARQRTFDDTTLVDVSWLYPEATLLETYTSVPLAKFSQSPASYMVNALSIPQRNLDDEDRFITWRMQAGPTEGSATFDPPSYGNNIFNNAHSIFPSAHPINSAPNNFVYSVDPDEEAAFWRVRFLTNTTPDINRYNDTITFVQELSNFYAYDDGSAEMGYGLNASGSKLAYRFDMVGGDSLRAVRMYFNPIANEPPLLPPTQGSFLLTVWSSLDPEVIVHQNFSFSSPEYRDHGVNRFVEYPLDSTIWLQGTFYIGWTQTNSANMNLGFDRNRNNSNKIFYKVGNNWQNTSFQGSLLMRPVFSTAYDPWVGLAEDAPMAQGITVYPNPANTFFHLRSRTPLSGGEQVHAFDGTGRLVLQEPFLEGGPISTHGLSNGLYLLRVLHPDGATLGQARLLIQH